MLFEWKLCFVGSPNYLFKLHLTSFTEWRDQNRERVAQRNRNFKVRVWRMLFSGMPVDTQKYTK